MNFVFPVQSFYFVISQHLIREALNNNYNMKIKLEFDFSLLPLSSVIYNVMRSHLFIFNLNDVLFLFLYLLTMYIIKKMIIKIKIK